MECNTESQSAFDRSHACASTIPQQFVFLGKLFLCRATLHALSLLLYFCSVLRPRRNTTDKSEAPEEVDEFPQRRNGTAFTDTSTVHLIPDLCYTLRLPADLYQYVYEPFHFVVLSSPNHCFVPSVWVVVFRPSYGNWRISCVSTRFAMFFCLLFVRIIVKFCCGNPLLVAQICPSITD
jgi:hypothetical protein